MEAQSSVFLNFLILWMQILSPTIMETLVEVVVLWVIPIEGDDQQTMKQPLFPTPLPEEVMAFHLRKEDQQTKRTHLRFTGLEMVKSLLEEHNPTMSQCLWASHVRIKVGIVLLEEDEQILPTTTNEAILNIVHDLQLDQ